MVCSEDESSFRCRPTNCIPLEGWLPLEGSHTACNLQTPSSSWSPPCHGGSVCMSREWVSSARTSSSTIINLLRSLCCPFLSFPCLLLIFFKSPAAIGEWRTWQAKDIAGSHSHKPARRRIRTLVALCGPGVTTQLGSTLIDSAALFRTAQPTPAWGRGLEKVP